MTRAFVAPDVRNSILAAVVRDPAALLARPEASFLKDHARTAVARVTVDRRLLYVKRFKAYAWYRRVEAWWAGSPAARAWKSAGLLRDLGFEVPRLLARVESGGESWLVSEAVAGGVPGAEHWFGHTRSPGERRELTVRAAATLRRFHDAGLYSRDTNANNFLVRDADDGTPDFVFLDLENVRRPFRVGRRRRVKNLVQVYRLFRTRVPRTVPVRFLHAYLGTTPGRRAPGRAEVRRWLRALTRIDLRKDAEYRRRAFKKGSAVLS